MRLSIFARLTIGYLLIFSLLAGVSLFFILHHHRLNQVIQSIILIDNELLDYTDQLSDHLLAESGYDRKFVVLKNEQLFENFQRTRGEFNSVLNQALALAGGTEATTFFQVIAADHARYTLLVEEERSLLKAAKPYNAEQFDAEKKTAVTGMINRLKGFRQSGEKNVFQKLLTLREMSEKAGNFALIITVVALFTGLVIAAVITRSITRPLNIIKNKTREIARGNFQGDLLITSPSAIGELALAINSMCHTLEAVDTIKSDFFSHMSHELRTPLASIKEGTNLLLEGHGGEVSEGQRRILTIVNRESNRLIQLVNALLDLSKMEAGMLAYNFTATDLAIPIRETIATLAPLAKAKSIVITNGVATLPPVLVDQERMIQVFRNLLGNALKFTPENGVITLSAEVKANSIEIKVADSGIGIPAAELERIFLKFRQVIPASGASSKGTGLGLATVRQIILAHGGKVWATSQQGSGSTFYVSLPLAA